MQDNQALATKLSELLAAYRSDSGTSNAFALRSHMVAHADQIIAALSPPATPAPDMVEAVAWTDEEAFRQMHLLYNYADDDSRQFTRWQMSTAMYSASQAALTACRAQVEGEIAALKAKVEALENRPVPYSPYTDVRFVP